jgi:hypothetical protein
MSSDAERSEKPSVKPGSASFLRGMARGVLGVLAIVALAPLMMFLSLAAALFSRDEKDDE